VDIDEAQRARRDRLALACEELALTTLGAAVRRIGDRPTPEELLGARYLADRLAALCADFAAGGRNPA
jgi:hypothetical protein